MSIWKLEDAKNQFSRVVQAALDEEPQLVTRHGHPVVVILSLAKYRQLAAPDQTFVDFMRRSPLAEAMAAGEFDLTRARDLPRDVDL